MTAVDNILDGLEAALELERELGVRVIEVDRALLSPPQGQREAPSSASAAGRTAGALKQAPGIAAARPAGRAKAESGGRVFDYVFLHDRDLSAAGAEMMAKIVAAMKMTRETAPLVCEGAVPPAKVLVVLGKFALQKWFPSLHGAPGQWLRGPQGECLLVTYSPEYILRFGSSSPAVRKLKLEMWAGLKAAMQRVQSGLT